MIESHGSFVAGYSIGDLEAEFVNREDSARADYPGKTSNYRIIVHTKPGGHVVWQNSHGQDSIKYHSLSVKNKDLSYPLKHTSVSANICFYQNFKGMELTSNQDYDERHKAGESLLDIVYYRASSCLNFIEGNYKPGPPYKGILVAGDSVSSREMTLLCWGSHFWLFELNFPIPPTLSKRHDFTVALVADDDTKYVLPVSAMFD